MNKRSTHISLFLTLLIGLASITHAAPPILNYSGQVAVDGSPFTGTAYLKFAFVNGSGQFSYWSHDGTSANGSEPDGNVSVSVSGGLYSIMIGDTQIAGMGEVDEAIFSNHNDVHLRVWFSDGVNGFEQITPDRRFASVPYVLGNDGTGTATFMDSTGSGSGSTTTSAQNYNFGGPLGIGYARLVADGPEKPSTTLVLLAGDSAEVASYVADMPGRLEYAFDAYTIALPRGDDALLSEQSTLIGPGSVRLTAPTGVVNVAILKVNRASGRDPNKVQGSPAPNSTEPAPAPAIVSVPQTRSVARGGTTTLFVSASGDDLSYQWKKNGVDISGATSAGLPLQNATGADEGNYTVVISNSEGSVTSDPIVVAVKMPAVPTGVYRINNSAGATGHDVALTGFSIDQHEVTKAFWDEVYAWAVNNGYGFTNVGIAEGPEHPVHSVNWYDCVKWANALSERDGHTPCYYTDNNCTQVYRTGEVDLTNYNVRWNVDGYRLPTESEWEVAARGGLEGSKYAWGESASTSKANFDQSLHGATLPVGSYPSMGYGLYEIGGNLREWVWDVQTSSDTNDYIYENHELFTHSSSGQLDLVENETTASYGWVGSEMWTNTSGYPIAYISPSTDFSSIETLSLPFPFLTNQIRFFIRARGYYYAKFFFLDGTEETTQQVNLESQGSDTITTCTVNNPSPGKLIKQISIYAKRYPGDWTYSRTRVFGFQIGKSYKSGSSSSTLLINLPEMNDYNSTSYRVSINNGEETPITFSLLDEAGNALVENGKFNEFQFLTNPTKISKLKFLIPASSGNPDKGGYSIFSVSWTLSNPKKS
ncbi:SUMF1/EgtB/PvdO family nonheme iron enzyme, partial [Opitutales bacterium]|nr:SUMF1/EgtB/PvdO family nonheme iron enzyme [Opitutales bacterium]